MKIAMLARNADLYSHHRLKEAAEARGHELDIINTLRCYMNIAVAPARDLLQRREAADV